MPCARPPPIPRKTCSSEIEGGQCKDAGRWGSNKHTFSIFGCVCGGGGGAGGGTPSRTHTSSPRPSATGYAHTNDLGSMGLSHVPSSSIVFGIRTKLQLVGGDIGGVWVNGKKLKWDEWEDYAKTTNVESLRINNWWIGACGAERGFQGRPRSTPRRTRRVPTPPIPPAEFPRTFNLGTVSGCVDRFRPEPHAHT